MSDERSSALEFVSTKWTAIALTLLGVATLVVYRVAVQSKTVPDIAWFLKLVVVQIVFYVCAAWLSARTADSRSLLVLVVVFAALFRLAIVFSPPYLSDDIYRYIWDGRVQASAVNPYRYIPADQALAGLRDEKIYPKINRRDYARTIYPPVAEGVFLLLTRVSESVTWMKAMMVGFEALAAWSIIELLASFGFARQRVLIYAWHPLAVWEFAGSGHLDAMAIGFIALALLAHRKNAESLTGVLLACATCVKLFPVVLFPALYKRWSWKMPLAFVATVVVAYVPYLSVGPLGVMGFLPGYASERGMVNGEQFFLLTAARELFHASVPAAVYVVFAFVVFGALSLWMLLKQPTDDLSYLRNGLLITSVFMLLLSPHFSWYFAWLLPFLCFIPSLAVLYLTFASFLLYLTWLGDSTHRVLILKALIFVPFFALGAIELWRRRK